MPSKETQDQKLSDRANELYWRSERSVNQIAEEMDLSKSRLYGLVRPLPAGSPCPQCQVELFFPNRTAMDKSFVSCPECGFEGTVPGEATSKAAPASAAGNGQAAARPRRAAQPRRAVQPATAASEPGPDKAPAPAGRRLSSKRVLWGSVLLGAAAGLYLAIRQRRS